MLRILGDTPSFRGIRDSQHDTPIELTRTENVGEREAAQCNATLAGSTSPVTEALNSGI